MAVAKAVSKQRERLLAAQAGRAELKLRKERGDLVHVDVVADVLEPVVIAIRQRLLALPGRASAQVVACNSIAEVHAILDGIVRECLSEISTLDPWLPSPALETRREVASARRTGRRGGRSKGGTTT